MPQIKLSNGKMIQLGSETLTESIDSYEQVVNGVLMHWISEVGEVNDELYGAVTRYFTPQG